MFLESFACYLILLYSQAILYQWNLSDIKIYYFIINSNNYWQINEIKVVVKFTNQQNKEAATTFKKYIILLMNALSIAITSLDGSL